MAEVPLLLRFTLVVFAMLIMGGSVLMFALSFKLAFAVMAIK